MEEKLKFIFNNVNDWLRFAEAKLAGLIVFNGAILIGIVQILNELFTMPCLIRLSILTQVVVNILSLIVALWGINPFFKKIKLKKGEIGIKDNVFYWGDIAKYGADSYLKKVIELAGIKDSYTELEKNLSNQIINNAKIASRKYFLFTLGLIITEIGLITSLILLIIYFF